MAELLFAFKGCGWDGRGCRRPQPPSGMSWTTTLPPPMTARLPIVTPGRTVTPPPNQTLSPTVMGLAYSSSSSRRVWSRGWAAV